LPTKESPFKEKGKESSEKKGGKTTFVRKEKESNRFKNPKNVQIFSPHVSDLDLFFTNVVDIHYDVACTVSSSWVVTYFPSGSGKNQAHQHPRPVNI
jgi:hypothetical protein